MTHLEKLGGWIAEVSSIPSDVRRAARAQALDMVAAAHASARSGIARPVIDGIRATASTGAATSLADGAQLAPVDAAMINCALSMAHDFDDIVWLGHTCHSAVFASLAVGEHLDSSASEVIDAIVVANEVAGRLGASSMLGPLNGQMWTFLHLVGSAAASARLLHLDAAQTTHALAISLAQPNFALQPGFLRPTSKLLAASTPTAAGIHAAFLARAGMTGAPEILEDPRGFWGRFTFQPLPEMLSDLGEFWVLRTLAVKTFPGCHYFQTAITAAERIVARRPAIARSSVKRVRIDSTKLGCEATRFAAEYAAGDLTAVGVNFDIGLSVAVMLHAGCFGVEQVEEEWLRANESEILAWRAMTEVRHDPALTAQTLATMGRVRAGREALRGIPAAALVGMARRYREEYRSRLISPSEVAGFVRAAASLWRSQGSASASVDGPVGLDFPNRVVIEFSDGSREEERIDLPVGALAAPGFEGQLETKAMTQLAPRLGDERAREAIRMAWNFQESSAREMARAWA